MSREEELTLIEWNIEQTITTKDLLLNQALGIIVSTKFFISARQAQILAGIEVPKILRAIAQKRYSKSFKYLFERRFFLTLLDHTK